MQQAHLTARIGSSRTVLAVGALVLAACASTPPVAMLDAPSDASAADAGAREGGNASFVCASSTPNDSSCSSSCGDGEVCFTQVSCGVTQDASVACVLEDGIAGDDRCHRACTDGGCPAGEDCFHLQFFGCGNFNGGPAGKGICCPAAGCR